jgi:hypothetical protein
VRRHSVAGGAFWKFLNRDFRIEWFDSSGLFPFLSVKAPVDPYFSVDLFRNVFLRLIGVAKQKSEPLLIARVGIHFPFLALLSTLFLVRQPTFI